MKATADEERAGEREQYTEPVFTRYGEITSMTHGRSGASPDGGSGSKRR